MPDYKYSEDVALQEIQRYVDATYEEHYADSPIQAGEYMIALGHGASYFLCNIIKYASRYGKKNGYNRKDILKVIHYGMMLLHVHNKEKENV